MTFTPQIAPEIHDRHPDFHFLSLVLRNATVDALDAPALQDLLAFAEGGVAAEDAQRDSHLAAWAEAYRALGAKPNRAPCPRQRPF